MEITIKREQSKNGGTTGNLLIDGDLFCYSLENEVRTNSPKIDGETAIPFGRYEIKKRKYLTPMTSLYRNKFDWFDFHLEITGVINFEDVYIHIGNFIKDTDGCPLVGSSKDPSYPAVWNSTETFKKFYLLVSKAIDEGEKVFITITER